MDEQLQNLGLEDTEAKVYLALLELGPSSVSEITKKAKITRTLGYHVLEKLGWYGLVNRTSSQGKKIQYSAEHPRSVLQFVKNKKNSWEKRIKEAEEILPDLVSLYKVAEKPVIRYQQGVEGIKAIHEEGLESQTEILAILDVDSWNIPELWQWAKWYNKERNQKKIKERILILDTPKGREWIKSYKGSTVYTLYRWVKPEDIEHFSAFGGSLNIYDHKVMIALVKNQYMGVIIESRTLVNILKGMFEFIWHRAEPVILKKRK